MSDTENVTGDVNMRDNDESVSQNELQGEGSANAPLDVTDVLGENPQVTGEAVESENAETQVPETEEENNNG